MVSRAEKLQGELHNLRAKRQKKLDEVKAIKKAVEEYNPKRNKWIIKLAEDIAKLDKYITQHENRIEMMERRRLTAEKAVERKRDTRRKILLGAFLENELKHGRIAHETLKNGLDQFLTREADRDLFDFLTESTETALWGVLGVFLLLPY